MAKKDPILNVQQNSFLSSDLIYIEAAQIELCLFCKSLKTSFPFQPLYMCYFSLSETKLSFPRPCGTPDICFFSFLFFYLLPWLSLVETRVETRSQAGRFVFFKQVRKGRTVDVHMLLLFWTALLYNVSSDINYRELRIHYNFQ